jgi:hypothetical protein
MGESINIFYSYAHEDERLRKKLETHLALFQQQGLIKAWHDREISAGREWANEINIHLEAAQIILLLVSSSFLASKYCYSSEMMRALERHETGSARVIPIILRPVYRQNAAFSKLQALPTGGKAITVWHNRDEAFANVAYGIHKVIDELRAQNNPASQIPESSESIENQGCSRPVYESIQGVAERQGKGLQQSGEAQQVLLPREESLSPTEFPQIAGSLRRSPRLSRAWFNRLHLPRFVVPVLLTLIFLSGAVGSLIYRAAIGYFPWQVSHGVSAFGRLWHSANLDNSGDLSGVTWSGSRFVVVGGSCRLLFLFCSGVIFTSPDGITWTSQSSGTAVDLLGVVWSGSRFVAVGNSGTILTSSDGITWTPQHPPTTKNLDDLVWFLYVFAAVSSAGLM